VSETRTIACRCHSTLVTSSHVQRIRVHHHPPSRSTRLFGAGDMAQVFISRKTLAHPGTLRRSHFRRRSSASTSTMTCSLYLTQAYQRLATSPCAFLSRGHHTPLAAQLWQPVRASLGVTDHIVYAIRGRSRRPRIASNLRPLSTWRLTTLP
jgi:hypothetical protein